MSRAKARPISPERDPSRQVAILGGSFKGRTGWVVPVEMGRLARAFAIRLVQIHDGPRVWLRTQRLVKA